jgi:hypothetical protein
LNLFPQHPYYSRNDKSTFSNFLQLSTTGTPILASASLRLGAAVPGTIELRLVWPGLLRQTATTKGWKTAMNGPVTTTTTLREWLLNPPTTVIYRPDGQLSLDQLPNMASPDAVVCFTTMHEAKRFVKEIHQRKLFRPVKLRLAKWLEAIKSEAEMGRTHLSIWSIPGDGTLGKSVLVRPDLEEPSSS